MAQYLSPHLSHAFLKLGNLSMHRLQRSRGPDLARRRRRGWLLRRRSVIVPVLIPVRVVLVMMIRLQTERQDEHTNLKRTHNQPKSNARQSKPSKIDHSLIRSFSRPTERARTKSHTHHEMFQRRKLARNDVSRAVRIHLLPTLSRDARCDVPRTSQRLNGFRF